MYCGELCGNPGWLVDSRFIARLRSFFVVPPLWLEAHGTARFCWVDNRRVLYKLSVFDLCGVISATINLGEFCHKGPVVAFLFGPVLEGENPDGLLAKGVLRDVNLIGPLEGKPLSCLVQEMRFGNAYVSVQTKKHPKGALRGQIEMTSTRVKRFPPPWRMGGWKSARCPADCDHPAGRPTDL